MVTNLGTNTYLLNNLPKQLSTRATGFQRGVTLSEYHYSAVFSTVQT
jgi:hypothetical protein